ncbi:MAG TPA: GNAT family protein [Acidimicrobiales bacterium]|nr:GNAT family protein [Acidimicrobiales bacterium]
MTTLNHLGQPVGDPLPAWTPRPRPPAEVIAGRWCRLEPLDPPRHAVALFEANGLDREGRMWTYLPCGPFGNLAEYRAYLDGIAPSDDPLFFAVVDAGLDRALGIASFLRIEPAAGSIEVGHLAFSPALQQSRVATEAMALMMRLAFDGLGYRRYEWKCDALNEPSRRAALRLGFTYEGTFRQAVVVKGRNRDTAWFSILDRDWPAVRTALTAWLDVANFDAEGRQRVSLSSLTCGHRGAPLARAE